MLVYCPWPYVCCNHAMPWPIRSMKTKGFGVWSEENSTIIKNKVKYEFSTIYSSLVTEVHLQKIFQSRKVKCDQVFVTVELMKSSSRSTPFPWSFTWCIPAEKYISKLFLWKTAGKKPAKAHSQEVWDFF